MHCHEVEYKVIGDDIQIVEIGLDIGETVIAEAGAMNYMDDGITFEAKMGDGSQPNEGLFGKILNAGKRVLTGESIFLTHFTNPGDGEKKSPLPHPTLERSFQLTCRRSGEKYFARKMLSSAPPLALR